MAVVLVPIAFFVCLAAAILGSNWIAYRRRAAALRAISDIAATGRPLDIGVVEQLLKRPKASIGKWFAIACFVLSAPTAAMGLALASSVVFLGEAMKLSPSGRAGMMTGALINLGIGLCYLTLGLASLRYFSGRRRPAPLWDYGTGLGLVSLFLGAPCLGTGLGLTFGAIQYVAFDPASAAGTGTGAFINLFIGAGFTLLGVVIFRLFGETDEPGPR